MKFSVENIKGLYLDIIKEIGNIGAGNAATSLSELINRKIEMEVPSVEILDTEQIVKILGGEDLVVCGVYLNFHGDINGTILLILDITSSNNLLSILFQRPVENFEYNDLEISALQEIGNILSSSYINSVSSLSNLKINISVPSVSIDMAGSILSVPAIEYGTISDKIILIENKLSEGGSEITAKFFLMPDIDSFKILFKSLGVLTDEE
ncbi:chemotaxis protein CheC [Alkalithermobacter thermoalcaliphilus JW-YL-7 = DSM 7308]|uniref:CheC, phosphatase, inhibitor of MCP methylation n=2 Tax=Clostridium paradoxum TaxID=29346 RepID=A0A150FQB0_CLOPD|nr:CheC, phosphatase, inhibitor of MCP methylation [[Clostridium] paradoxum JW-YL-7 = DSM 7308]SHK60329.1 chemotaxis protein CheC [[Clostridium] paradoxum JW-YL-7 = DSM 7308]